MVALMVLGLTSCNFFDKMVDSVASANEKLIPKGSISGNVYTSGYSSLRFTKPDSWEYASDEKLAEMMEQSLSGSDYGELAKGAAEMGMRIDMYALDAQNGTSVNVMYQNLDLLNISQSVDEYRATVESQISEQTSGEYVRLTDKEVTLCGETYHKQAFRYEMQGVGVIQVHYFRINDGVLEMVTVGYIENVLTTDEIESMFS